MPIEPPHIISHHKQRIRLKMREIRPCMATANGQHFPFTYMDMKKGKVRLTVSLKEKTRRRTHSRKFFGELKTTTLLRMYEI